MNGFGHDPRMMCQMCPDRNRSRHAADDARRILRNIERLIDPEIQRESRHMRQTRRHPLFHHAVSCHWNHGCNQFAQNKHDLQRAEQELEIAYDMICASLKKLQEAGDTQKANVVRRQCFDLFRGHYPNAAQAIERAELV